MWRLFKITVLLLAFLQVPSVLAIEQIQARTEKPQQEVSKNDDTTNIAPQTDGIEIQFPFLRKSKKVENEEAVATVQKPKNEIFMDSDEIEYNADENTVEIKGNVVIVAKPNNIKLTADKGVFDTTKNIVKLYDNVVLTKGKASVTGQYMIIDLNEQNVLIDEPIGKFTTFKITGREGYAYGDRLESVNGEIELDDKTQYTFSSDRFLLLYDPTIVQPELATDSIRKQRADNFKIHTQEIIINSDKDRDNVVFKNADIYYKKVKVATAPNLEFMSDKEQSYIETNVPEIGSMADFGTYIGPGFVFKTPGSSTLKLIPVVLDNDEGFGVGLFARHRSKRNYIVGGYSFNNQNLLIRGKYEINKELWIDYGRHAYFDEWFYGARQPGNLLQLVHEKNWYNNDLDLDYKQRLTAGWVSDYNFDDSEKEWHGTARLRYQGQLTKSFYTLGDREQDMFLDFAGYSQFGATLYGKGDTHAVARIGPQLNSRVKNWGSRISMALSGIHGRSPYHFDDYRYGKLSFTVDQNLRLNRYITLGYQATITPLKDNPDENLLAENRFYVMAGPEDIKLAFSYDAERELAYFDVLFFLGSNVLKSSYDKLTVKNIDKFGKKPEMFEDFQYYKLKVPEEL